MNKHFIIFFLVGAMTVQLSHKMLLVLHFNIYKQEITASKCVNKDKPKLKCNGKCHLKKKLEEKAQQSPNDDSTLPGLLKKLLEEQIYYLPLIESYIYNKFLNFGRWAAFNYCQNYRFSYLLTIFHPPEIIKSRKSYF